MKVFLTVESCRKIRSFVSNICSYCVIDIDEILKDSGLDITRPVHRYLINTEIARLITAASKSKRYIGIIYINSNINDEYILELKENIKNLPDTGIDSLAILDDFDTPKLKKYYKFFDEVVFFQPLRRGRIVECTPIEIKDNKNVFKKNF